MSKIVLITGASGFVGSRLAARLIQENYEVHAVVRANSNLWRIKNLHTLFLHTCHLENLDEARKLIMLIKPDLLFHLACYGGFADQSDPVVTFNTNTLITFNLLQACVQHFLDKFIFVGSSSEYGIKPSAMSEDLLERPNSLYGVTKLAATHLVRLFGEQQILPTMILRIFSPYGVQDDPRRLIPSVINACLKKQTLKLGTGKAVRDYIYVEDLMDAFLLAIKAHSVHGEIINLGSGQQYSVISVVNHILGLCDHPIQPEWGQLPDRKHEPQSWIADITKANKILHWRPTTTITEGLKKTIVWHQNGMQS